MSANLVVFCETFEDHYTLGKAEIRGVFCLTGESRKMLVFRVFFALNLVRLAGRGRAVRAVPSGGSTGRASSPRAPREAGGRPRLSAGVLRAPPPPSAPGAGSAAGGGSRGSWARTPRGRVSRCRVLECCRRRDPVCERCRHAAPQLGRCEACCVGKKSRGRQPWDCRAP